LKLTRNELAGVKDGIDLLDGTAQQITCGVELGRGGGVSVRGIHQGA
jgi:hypothetical protein